MLKKHGVWLIDTEERRNTKIFIKKVLKFKEEFAGVFQNTINSLKEISDKIINMLEKDESSYENFSSLIILNQKCLEILPISNSKIAKII